MTAESTRDALVRQLGLDDEARELLDRAIKTQKAITRKQGEIDALIKVRRADVLGLHGRHRVSKYRLAQVLDVSQTTVGNITNREPSEAPHEGAEE
jgi:hypothetical protein